MPISPLLARSLATQIVNFLPRATTPYKECQKIQKAAEDAINDFLKDSLVMIVGPLSIQAAAQELDLVLADDELEYVAKRLQDSYDSDRGPISANIENEVESLYLEDTKEKTRRNCPDFWVCKVDETEHWNKEFLKKHSIKKISNVYLLDKQEVTNCCSADTNYCLHYVTYVAEHVDEDKQITDAADMEIMSTEQHPIWYVLESRYKDMIEEENEWRPDPLTTDMYEEEEDYRSLLDETMLSYHEAPIW